MLFLPTGCICELVTNMQLSAAIGVASTGTWMMYNMDGVQHRKKKKKKKRKKKKTFSIVRLLWHSYPCIS